MRSIASPFLGMTRPFSRGRGAFTIADLFASGEQGVWYDPSDLTTLYQDSAGTTAVTADGDPVGYMGDKSGNGNHATQSTAAARPVYKTDGTLHWLAFDGVDDSLSLPDIPFSGDTGFNVFAAADTTNLGTSARIAFARNSDRPVDTPAAYFAGSGDYQPFIYDQGTFRAGNATTRDNAIFSWQVSLTAAGQRTAVTRVNQAEVSQVYTKRSLPANEVFSSINSSDAQISKIDLYGAVIRCATPLGATEISNTETYLADKAGVTL